MRDLVECRPKSIHTTALPSRASVRACSSVSDRSPSRASASFRTMSLYLPSCRMFSSEENDREHLCAALGGLSHVDEL